MFYMNSLRVKNHIHELIWKNLNIRKGNINCKRIYQLQKK